MVVIKWIGICIGVLVVALALWLLSMRMGMWNPSYDEVRQKYAGPPSKFVKVGDVNLHVRDEGKGPVVLMLHSSMSNLSIWDGWADVLKKKYRVIRIDWPPYGLSRDPKPSTGTAGVAKIVAAFVQQQNLTDMTIVGSSCGATLAVMYTAAHPERVRALALSTLPLSAPPPTKIPFIDTAIVWTHDNLVPNYNPRFWYNRSLPLLYGTPSRLKPETVDWYWAMNNIPGNFERVATYYKANTGSLWKSGAGDEAAKIRVPILLQWGDKDIVLPISRVPDAVSKFSNAKVEVIHYPDVGHYPMLELPEQTGQDLLSFVDRVHASAPVRAGAGALRGTR
jgi:pimeloyl-ACP methyl ester carboxylesterase